MNNEQVHKCVPTRRFPEFKNDGKWKACVLGDIADFYKGKGISKSEASENGKIPCVRYGELYTYYKEVITETKSFTNNSVGDLFLSKANDVIIPSSGETKEDISTASCVMKDGIALGGDINIIRSSNNGIFLSYYLNNVKKGDIAKIAQGISIIHLYNEQLKELKICCPSLAEQKKIADCLSSMDNLILASKNKLELLKKQKNGLMQKLFPVNGKTVPEIRFKEFEKDGEWKMKKLGDITYMLNRRNKSNRNLPIYSINNKGGFTPQSEQFQGLDSNRRGYDISLYKIVTGKTFVYNPARINVGSIGYSGDIKECIVSSLYVCFKTIDEVDDDFLKYLLGTSCFRQGVENNVEGGIRNYLFYENFSKIKIMLPSFSEQKKISLCLKAVDEKISFFSCKIAELELLKKGVLQGVFPTTI